VSAGRPIRVVVAEDSFAARQLLIAIIESDAGIRVVGEAGDGATAVELAERLRPDLVTMDIEMPIMSGLDATREIMRRSPTPILVVSSMISREDMTAALEALRVGAVSAIGKPAGPGSPGFEHDRAELIATVRSMAEVKVVRQWHAESPAARRPTPRTRHAAPARIVAIAASTGGPAAVQQLISVLPADLPVPLLLVQHIARGFTEAFAGWLDRAGRLRVRRATDLEPLRPGHLYIAPDERHLGVAGGRLALSDAPPVGGFRPSATFLFEGVAREYGAAVLAVILTGMGEDGVAGLRAVRAAGGRVLAQDEASCVVYGMPRSAIRAGLADAVLPPADIGLRIRALARG